MFSASLDKDQSSLSLSFSRRDVGVFHTSIQIAYLGLERHATEANASTYLPVHVYIRTRWNNTGDDVIARSRRFCTNGTGYTCVCPRRWSEQYIAR